MMPKVGRPEDDDDDDRRQPRFQETKLIKNFAPHFGRSRHLRRERTELANFDETETGRKNASPVSTRGDHKI